MPELRGRVHNLARKLQRILAALRVADRMPPLPAAPRVLLSCHDVDRSMLGERGAYSPMLEGLRALFAELGWTAVNLTHPFALAPSARVQGNTITINRAVMRIRLGALVVRCAKGARAAAEWRGQREQALYAGLLARIAPVAVVSIQPPAALCRVARATGTLLAEAMHGTNVSLADPVFRQHMSAPDADLPPIVLAFDDVTQHTLASLCNARAIRPVRANDPWLHRLAWLQEERNQPIGRIPCEGYARRILVTTQWGYDGERESLSGIIPNGILHPALEEAFARAAERGIGVLLRVHPIQMNGAGYRRHRRYLERVAGARPNVEIVESSRLPLPLLLEHVDGHVTMSSSAVGEAAVAGVPSLLLCPTLQPGAAHDGLFRELEAEGLAHFGELDPEAVVAWMATATASRPPRPPFAPRHRRELEFYREVFAA